MKEKFGAVQPRAAGGADRHADLGAPGRADRADPDCSSARGRSPTEQVETYNRQEHGGGEGARAARGRSARASSRRASPSPSCRSWCSRTTARPTWRARSRKRCKIQTHRRAPRRAGSRVLGEGEARQGAGDRRRRSAARGTRRRRAGAWRSRSRSAPTAARASSSRSRVMNRFSEAIQASGVDVVPRVVVGGAARRQRRRRRRRRATSCRRCSTHAAVGEDGGDVAGASDAAQRRGRGRAPADPREHGGHRQEIR